MSRAEVLQLPGSEGMPTPDPVILESLYRIEQGLCVGWSKYLLDWRRTPPRVLEHERTRKPLELERWYICLRTHDGVIRMLFRNESPKGDPWPLDRRVVERLLGDLARRMKPAQIAKLATDAASEHTELRKRRMANLQQDVLAANKRKIEEVFEGDNLNLPAAASMRRDGRIVSYPGQGDRSSHHENITMTPQERGWELPDYEKELKE